MQDLDKDTFPHEMVKDLQNGIRIVVHARNAASFKLFPMVVEVKSYNEVIEELEINSFDDSKDIESSWSKAVIAQYILVEEPLEKLGYRCKI